MTESALRQGRRISPRGDQAGRNRHEDSLGIPGRLRRNAQSSSSTRTAEARRCRCGVRTRGRVKSLEKAAPQQLSPRSSIRPISSTASNSNHERCPRFIFGEQLGRRSPARLILEIDISQLLTVGVQRHRATVMIDYSHGEYRHCTAVTSSLTEGSGAGTGRGQGTGSATSTGRGVGTGTAASSGRGVGTGAAASSGRGVGTGAAASPVRGE